MGITEIQEKQSVAEVLLQTCLREKSSETGLTMILQVGAYANQPLQELLPEITIPVMFMYGNSDWMQRVTPDFMVKEG